MTVDEGFIADCACSISEIYSQIILSNIPEDESYSGYFDGNNQFALGRNGYRDTYLGLIGKIFTNERFAYSWSEEGIQALGHELLRELAYIKNQNLALPDFMDIARKWLEKIDIPYQEYRCYSSVIGLSVDSPLELGNVTFLPLNYDQPELNSKLGNSFRKELNSYRNCISFASVATADRRRASEIHRQKTEYALNILRFLASLIWYDQPSHHVYVTNENLQRISDSLVVANDGTTSSVGSSDFIPLPIKIDCEILQLANFYGLEDLQSLLKSNTLTDLQRSFLSAIQWYGQATQELSPLIAFIKFYISIEVVLKKANETASKVLPRRLGILINPWDKSRLAELEEDIQAFINERNNVFHSGIPHQESPERLAWDAKVLARQVLHQLRRHLKSDGWQNIDDLISWVQSRHSRYHI